MRYGILIGLGIITVLFACNQQPNDKQNQNYNSSTKLVVSYPSIKAHLEEGDSTLFDCYDGDRMEMTLCAAQEFRYYDDLLELEFAELMGQLEEGEYKTAIKDSQAKWHQLRKANSEIIRINHSEGSMLTLMYHYQMLADTRNRLRFIQDLLGT